MDGQLSGAEVPPSVPPVPPVSGPTPMLDVVRRFLAGHDIAAERVEGETILRMEGTGANGEWTLWIQTREDEGLCLVWSSWPQAVPEDRRVAVMELVTRINPDLAVGAFELDLDRGQLSLRTSIDVTGDRLTEALVARLVGANVETFDDHLPALLDAIG